MSRRLRLACLVLAAVVSLLMTATVVGAGDQPISIQHGVFTYRAVPGYASTKKLIPWEIEVGNARSTSMKEVMLRVDLPREEVMHTYFESSPLGLTVQRHVSRGRVVWMVHNLRPQESFVVDIYAKTAAKVGKLCRNRFLVEVSGGFRMVRPLPCVLIVSE